MNIGKLKYFLLIVFLTGTIWAQPNKLSSSPKEAAVAIQSKFNQPKSIHQNPAETRSQVKYPAYLNSLDSFLNNAVRKGVFPGCQVFASVNGNVIYNKSFGFYSYIQSPRINDSTLYDIASVTKIAATTLAVMQLVDSGKININSTLGQYIPELVKGSNKENLTIKDLLLHQAGLKSWIPFYKNTLDSATKRPSPELYRTERTEGFTTPVARNLFIKNNYKDSVWSIIMNLPLGNKGRYVYSDLDFYFLQAVVEKISGKGLATYVDQHFYKPLQLKNTLFNPWAVGRINECSPTEKDDYFRYQLITGYVHDPGAAMLGGAAGHAGLFSTASDIGVLMQMLLNGGSYRSRQYISPETIKIFTSYQSSISRRGLGFDKPEKEKGSGTPAGNLASKSTFGHQGFTGTCVWADPESGVVFVFLSNRINPTANNGLISKLNIRTEAQDYIYKALGYGK